MNTLILHTISGPSLPEVPLDPAKELSLGRSSTQDIRLNDPSVSRRHALLEFQNGRWMLTDLKSRHGTQINGIPLPPEQPTPVALGDRVSLGPWTLVVRSNDVAPSSLVSVDDTARRSDSVTRVRGDELGTLAERRLTLLMDSAKSIHLAADENAIARCAVEALVAGTGFARAVFVRPIRGEEELDVLAVAPALPPGSSESELELSRSLIHAARTGIVKLEDNAALQQAVSIISMGIAEAICAPVNVGNQPDSFLYLDSLKSSRTPQPDAAAFCAAVADIVAMSLANQRRRDLELRQQALDRDLHDAHQVQISLLPPESGSIGKADYARHSQPGRYVAGDLFGIAEIAGGKTGVFLGDITGKGIGAAMHMAAIHPRLTAWLESGMPLLETVARLNEYMSKYSADHVFVTMWLAIIDAESRVMQCVDAGHGYAAIVPASGEPSRLECDGGVPIGIDSDSDFQQSELALHPGDRLILFSDGVPEQRSSDDGGEFGFERVLGALARSEGMHRDIHEILQGLSAHAGGQSFADDVTIATVTVRN